ncbi:MAG: T9SS type A sorting domain-containing protein [Bacteroidota bacterium]
MKVLSGVLVTRTLFLLLAVGMISSHAAGQGSFSLQLIGRDGGGATDTLLFGRDSRGSYCIDPVVFNEGTRTFQEFELPPAPPAGVFDIRFVNHRSGLGGCTAATERGNGLRFDIRGNSGVSQVDTFQVKFQAGVGQVTLSWQPGLLVFCDSMRLKDPFGGIIANINMLTTLSYVVTNPGITQMTVFMYRAPGVTLIAPSNGNTVPPSLNLSWNEIEDATRYRVQVATDSSFVQGSLVVHDSLVAATSLAVAGLSSPATYYWRVAAGAPQGWAAFSLTRLFRTGTVPTSPSLVAPADGATNQPTSIPFRWTSSVEAGTYHLQISTASNFSTFVVNDSTITDTTSTVSSLGFSSTYHWRVAARNGVGASAFTPSRSFTTQLQPPPAPVLSSPANGQTGLTTTLTLNWTPTGGSVTYRVQVATDSLFATGIVLDDTTVATASRQVGPVAFSTKYYWKVTAKNLAGYGPSSATWNFTTAIAAPGAPALVSPPDGAQNLPLTPTLTWNAVATATSYRLQVARDTNFTQIAFDDSSLSSASQQVGPLLTNTSYYWRVRAKNSGGSSAFSSRFRFVTTAAPPVPLQVLPADSALRVDRSPILVWNRVPGVTAYHVQVATSAGFTTLLTNDSTVTDSARQFGPYPYGARLHWRIRSRNSAGGSEFSSSRVFTVQLQPPALAVLVSPANNAVNQAAVTTLRWQAASLAAWYHIEIALDTLMTNMFISDSSVADTARLSRLAPNSAYYWRVRGLNTEGTAGPFSVVRRFTTGNVVPATPLPFSPANNDTNVSRTPMLRWVESPGAFSYRAQVSFDNLFTQIISDDSTLTDNEYQPGLLLPNTPYYWRVRARGTAGNSPYSIIHRFTTGTLIVGVDEDPVPASAVPETFTLLQNYPNPFNPSTTIRFFAQSAAMITLEVYDMLGRHVSILASGDYSPGMYDVIWNGHDDGGNIVPSGVYFVRMNAAPRDGQQRSSSMRKLVFMK